MDRSLKRLKDLLRQAGTYQEFERRVLSFPRWYLQGLQTWTKATLQAFYVQNGGK